MRLRTIWRVVGAGLLALGTAGCAGTPAATVTPRPAATAEVTRAATVTALASAAPQATATVADTATPAEPAGPALVAGQWTGMFYYPPLERVVLVNGGPDRGKPASDPLELWAWDGATWSLLAADADGPRWRNFAGAAYDTRRAVLVVQGGVQSRGAYLEDTWEWNGTTWTELTGPGPGPREGAEAAYDAARGQVILFGGAAGETIAGDTWAWDGAAWTLVSMTGPEPRFPNAMVYDAAREVVLLYGGHYVGATEVLEYGDLWAWDGAAWRQLEPGAPDPGYRIVSRLVWDPAAARTLMFGGGDGAFRTDVWAWDGTAWAQWTPEGAPARSGMSGAFDAARGVLVAFGGVERPGGTALTETWEWDGEGWRCAAGCP